MRRRRYDYDDDYDDDDYDEYDYDDSRRHRRGSRGRRSSGGCMAWILYGGIIILALLAMLGLWTAEQVGEGIASSGSGVSEYVREMKPGSIQDGRVPEMLPTIDPALVTWPKDMPEQQLPKGAAVESCDHIHWEEGVGGSDFTLGYDDPCWWAFPSAMQKAYFDWREGK